MNKPFAILFLAANPDLTDHLELGRECRAITEALKRAEHRNRFHLESRWAVNPDDLRRALLEVKPRIVHFSGHGHSDGIALEDELKLAVAVSGPALARLFELASRQVEVVVLNACYSEKQAKAISRCVRHVIGMNDEVSDKATLRFAVGFYDGLGAGLSVEEAFQLGVNALQLEGNAAATIPVLKTNPSIPAPHARASSAKRRTPSRPDAKSKANQSTASTVIQTGPGGIAVGDGAMAAGAGGIAIQGNVHGDISTGMLGRRKG